MRSLGQTADQTRFVIKYNSRATRATDQGLRVFKPPMEALGQLGIAVVKILGVAVDVAAGVGADVECKVGHGRRRCGGGFCAARARR